MTDEIQQWLDQLQGDELPGGLRIAYEDLKVMRQALEGLGLRYIRTDFPVRKYTGRFGSRHNTKGSTDIFRATKKSNDGSRLEVRVGMRESFGHWFGFLSCRKAEKR